MKSKLTTVTLTGADDTVDPARLMAVSAQYQQLGFAVEWGILIGSQSGHRFPSPEWIRTLLALADKGVNLSLHICGQHLKRITEGKSIDLLPKMERFRRCQLNWHAEPQGDIAPFIRRAFIAMDAAWAPEVIFQLDGKNEKLFSECSRGMPRTSALHDLSHGAGVLPSAWPQHNVFPDYVGYAGGLGPDNLREQLPKIAEAAYGDFWIDMETKLFDGLQFSIAKCADVLDIVRGFKQNHER